MHQHAPDPTPVYEKSLQKHKAHLAVVVPVLLLLSRDEGRVSGRVAADWVGAFTAGRVAPGLETRTGEAAGGVCGVIGTVWRVLVGAAVGEISVGEISTVGVALVEVVGSELVGAAVEVGEVGLAPTEEFHE